MVDVIVVYKVDRLTRALSDFAKIVEVLDARGASFVSVTQAFNTTTSMGRLTLNVLLSFAQFEREVTGERIRDKIAASKKKGMWMGGPIPIGYDVVDRKLIVNEAEAETVRLIFERHQAVGTLTALVDDLAARGVTSKRRKMRDGRIVGGTPYMAGALTHLLRNTLYVGSVRHGDQVYPGEHRAILDAATWDASQALLDCNAPRPHTGQVSLLAGLVSDPLDRPMQPAHAIKGGKRYRYYVSRITAADDAEPAWRVPAGDLEAMVGKATRDLLADPIRLAADLGVAAPTAPLIERCASLVERIVNPTTLRDVLVQAGMSVAISHDAITISMPPAPLAAMLGISIGSDDLERIEVSLPALLKRRGHELKLVHAQPEARAPQRDQRLIQLLGSARAALAMLETEGDRIETDRRRHLVRLARLVFLAPDIITSILAGRQPVELTSRALLRISNLPMVWSEQRKVLGFA